MVTSIVIRHVEVEQVKERFHMQWKKGTGKEAVFTNTSQGWYILLHGSWEALYVGEEKPDIEPGDTVKITITKE